MNHLALLIAYLLGTIPFWLLLTRAAGLGDIRAIGSGNIGATNVMRTGNKKLGIATLLCDGLKGAAAVWIARWLEADEMLAAIAVIIGHVFPVWLGFKGGKGVATYLGAMLALAPILGLLIAACWLTIFAATRTSSLSALMSIGLSPLFAFALVSPAQGLVSALLAALIFYTHRSNIRRLIAGEEGNFGKRRP